MEEKRLVPKRRFKNYTKKWEQKKLGDFGTVEMNKRIFKWQTSSNGDVPFYKIGTFGKKPDAFISYELFQEYKQKYPYPEIGDLLLSTSGSIGKIVEYKGADEYFQDSNIVWLKHDGKIDNLFLKQYYQIIKWNGLEGSTIKRLYNKDILETVIKLPLENDEQREIGKFFKILDDWIANQKKKIAKVKALKEAYLTEMFPEKDETVPKRRFKGFDGEWKHLLLEEVILSEEKGQVNANMLGGTTPYLETEYLNGGKISYVTAKKNVEKEDILILWDGSNAGTVYHGFEGALGSTLKVYKPKYNGSFLYYFLKRHQKHIYRNYRTPNIPHVINTFTSEFEVKMPELKEQEKIGSFFKNLDNQIEAEEAKLEKLKKMKEAYLEEMFV